MSKKCLHAYMYVLHMHNWGQGGQKRASDPLEIMLQVSCHVSAGKQTQVLYKSSRRSQLPTISPAPFGLLRQLSCVTSLLFNSRSSSFNLPSARMTRVGHHGRHKRCQPKHLMSLTNSLAILSLPNLYFCKDTPKLEKGVLLTF